MSKLKQEHTNDNESLRNTEVCHNSQPVCRT